MTNRKAPCLYDHDFAGHWDFFLGVLFEVVPQSITREFWKPSPMCSSAAKLAFKNTLPSFRKPFAIPTSPKTSD